MRAKSLDYTPGLVCYHKRMAIAQKEITSEAAAIFLKAADYIRRYGWQEKGMSRHGLPRCSMGALESACANSKLDKDVAELMYDTLYEELDGLTLTEFNRQAIDGRREVPLLFDRVAASLLTV